MARVYLETSFVSACVTDRTDVASRYWREISREWWATQRRNHEVFVSPEVILELGQPGFRKSTEALAWIDGVPSVEADDRALGIAQILVREKVMPEPASGDAMHVALACSHRMDYILSWNVRHLANPNKVKHLALICVRLGVIPPRIVTPDFLWEDDHE